jgi:ABC-type glycerol-3-phosphate transport system permease component
MSMTYRRRRQAKSLFVHLIALLATLAMLAPLTWIVVTSLRPLEDIVTVPIRIIPSEITLQAYVDMWDRAPLLKFVQNSVIVSTMTAGICLVISSLAAYAFARFQFWGARVLLTFVLISQSLPGASILLPLFRVVQELGMIDTRQGLILVYTGFITPFCTWLLIGYFRSIPRELEDAARVDGASNLQVLYRIVVPLSAPAMVAVGAFAFLAAWNEFLFGFILTRDHASTVAVGLVTNYFSQYVNLWNQVAAASIVFSLPPILLFLLVQRQFISGLTAGAVKG